MDVDEVMLDCEDKMEKAVAVFVEHVKGLRTGRASPALVENVRVECYGANCPLREVASITAPDARLLVVKPFDASILKDIDRAIQKADLGLNPSNDGKLLRIQIPPLSEERRKQMVAVLKDQPEKAKVAIRNVRRDANKTADGLEGVSDDAVDGCKATIQEHTKTYETRVDEHFKKKSEEIMTV